MITICVWLLIELIVLWQKLVLPIHKKFPKRHLFYLRLKKVDAAAENNHMRKHNLEGAVESALSTTPVVAMPRVLKKDIGVGPWRYLLLNTIHSISILFHDTFTFSTL